MALAGIQQLVKEYEMALLRERRSAERNPFVRPVTITTVQEETHYAFHVIVPCRALALSATRRGLFPQLPL